MTRRLVSGAVAGLVAAAFAGGAVDAVAQTKGYVPGTAPCPANGGYVCNAYPTPTDGVVKSCVFGVTCSLIAVYEGYTAIPTAEGVGRATTRTVVISAVLVLMLNYMLTAVMLR